MCNIAWAYILLKYMHVAYNIARTLVAFMRNQVQIILYYL